MLRTAETKVKGEEGEKWRGHRRGARAPRGSPAARWAHTGGQQACIPQYLLILLHTGPRACGDRPHSQKLSRAKSMELRGRR